MSLSDGSPMDCAPGSQSVALRFVKNSAVRSFIVCEVSVQLGPQRRFPYCVLHPLTGYWKLYKMLSHPQFCSSFPKLGIWGSQVDSHPQ